MHHVSVRETKLSFQPHRVLEEPAYDLPLRPRRIGLELVQDAVGDLLGNVVPAPAVPQRVRVVLGPEPEDLAAGRGERVVDGRETHGDERGILRRQAAEVVAVRVADLLPVATDQLERHAGSVIRAARVTGGLGERQPQDGPEAVTDAHPGQLWWPVGLWQQPP